MVTGLQAAIWVVFLCLGFTGPDWINTDTTSQLTNWAGLITVVLLIFAYTLGTIVDRVADSVLGWLFDARFRKRWFDGEDSRQKRTSENMLAEVRSGVMCREKTEACLPKIFVNT